MIQFSYTILYVPDVEEAISFYERAFGFERKFVTLDYGELATGNTILSFASIELAMGNLDAGFIESKLSQEPFGIEIGFCTDNVEETYKNAVRQGATPESPPIFKQHGQTVAYVRDLNGFLIEICSPI